MYAYCAGYLFHYCFVYVILIYKIKLGLEEKSFLIDINNLLLLLLSIENRNMSISMYDYHITLNGSFFMPIYLRERKSTVTYVVFFSISMLFFFSISMFFFLPI